MKKQQRRNCQKAKKVRARKARARKVLARKKDKPIRTGLPVMTLALGGLLAGSWARCDPGSVFL